MGSGNQAPPCYKLQTFQFFNFPNSKTNQPVKMAVSKIRQNYHEDCEALINKQINMEFYASYVYLSVSSYFSRDDQALPGFASHFAKEAEEEREHGMKLMAYQSKRGGRCVFQDIAKPVTMEWVPALSWRKLSTKACSSSLTGSPGHTRSITCPAGRWR